MPKQISSKNVNEALAALIASTRSKKRKLSLVSIAEHLATALASLGSYGEVADRIGLSAKMLRQFSYVRRLTPEVQLLFARRKLDSVDAATHLAMLVREDQKVVAQSLAKRRLDTEDVRAIVQWRETKPDEHIKRLVEGVIASKTQQHYVVEFVVRGAMKKTQIVKRLRQFIADANIMRLDVDGPLGRLVLNRDGKRELLQAAKAKHVPVKHIMAAILYDSGAE